MSIDRQYSVAFLHSNLRCRHIGHDRVCHCRKERTHERGFCLHHIQEIQGTRQIHRHGFSLTNHLHLLCCSDIAIQVGTKIFEGTLLCSHENITIAETESLSLFIKLHTASHVFHWHIGISPIEENHGVDKQRKEEVDQHTAYHDQQSLPCRFASELPRLCGLLHLVGIEALVDHTGNLAITAKRSEER